MSGPGGSDGLRHYPDLPPDWRTKRLKHICSRYAEYGANEPASSYVTDGVRFLRTSDIDDSGSLSPPDQGVCLPADLVSDYLLEDGDLLISRSGTVGRSFLYREHEHGACAYAGYLVRFRPRPDQVAKFLFYFTKTAGFFRQIDEASVQTTITNFNGKKYASMFLPVPPKSDQKAIVSFLDRKTGAIDDLMRKKERQIELLDEKRQALIAQAVTKGLCPETPLTESTIPWFGAIPRHWAVVRLGYFATVKNGSTPSRSRFDYWEGGTIPWLSSGKVNDYEIESCSELITEKALSECSLEVFPSETVVMGLIGQGKTRGTCAMMKIDACINQNMAAIVPGRMLAASYLHQLMIHMYKPIRELARGGNQAALNCDIVADVRVPLPPLDEQLGIASHLVAAQEEDGRIKTLLQSQIGKLREYKKTLISDCVTGKLDPLGAAA